MGMTSRAVGSKAEPRGTTRGGRGDWLRRRSALLIGGGTDGNEQLTSLTGAVLILLLAALGVTILRVRQLISVHLFVGLVLIGPVVLKMASTGYRFVRYYAGNLRYRANGPPELPMRVIAPLVVISTAIVFASGLVLLFEGPQHRGQWVFIHKASFFAWLAVTGLHVLGHLPTMAASLRTATHERAEIGRLRAGSAGRWISLAGALAGGVLLAVLLIPHFGAWTAPGALRHHAGDH